MSSTAETTFIEIDAAGDLQIKVIETVDDIEHQTTFSVSSKILSASSDAFKRHISENGTSTIEIKNISAASFSLLLRISHKSVTDEHLSLSITGYQSMVDIGKLYLFDLSKAVVWFSLWLGSQHLHSSDLDYLRQILEVSNRLNHIKASYLLKILITELTSGTTDPAATAFKFFPPVPIPSTRQDSILIFLCRVVPVQEYERWGFSLSFQNIYGLPMDYYSDFYRLMTTSFDQSVVPKLARFASLGEDEMSGRFLWFCRMSDLMARKEGKKMLKRREMEAAWVWVSFELYEGDSRVEASSLRKVVAQRIHPREKVEEYWAEKRAAFGWAAVDVEFLAEGCEEDPETEKIVDGDEDLEIEMEMDVVAAEEAEPEGMTLAFRPAVREA